MQTKTLQTKRALRTALLVLLLGVAGMTYAQTGNIVFADANVKAICVEHWDSDGDEELSYAEATEVTDLDGAFRFNSDIYTFDELQYFTGLSWINHGDFYECRNLSSIIIPSSVRGIDYAAFSICTSLSFITIPNSVTTIGEKAFSSCTSLSSITIPNSVTTIGNETFNSCTSLSSITIPNSVTSIGFGAFIDCTSLSSVIIGNSVTEIRGAFRGCTSLSSIDIPNSVVSIVSKAFMDCTSLSFVNIPNSVTTIGQEAFLGCTSLSSIDIPNSVITIGDWTFSNCTSLNSIIIPNSVTSIGKMAFNCCINLESINIPNSVTLIGGGAFYGCTKLNSVILGNSVTTIEDSAFFGCTSLNSIVIPNSVTLIGYGAFGECSNLSSIVVVEDNPVFDSRENCNAIIEIETNSLIIGCITTIIPNSVTSIGAYAFADCANLSSITIPNSITFIGEYAFEDCTSLNSVIIGNSVTEIDFQAFSNCRNLEEVVALSLVPPILSYSFDYTDNVILTVSCGSKEAYMASDWANYFTTIEDDCGTHSVSIHNISFHGGSVIVSDTVAEVGEEVQITVTPDDGMTIDSVLVYDADNPSVVVQFYQIGTGSFIYAFLMPSFDVEIKVVFKPGSAVDENSGIEVSVYPNPTNGQLKIEAEGIKHVTVSNTLGQVIYEGKTEGDVFEYDFGKHEAGVYLVRIETANGVAVKKVTVTR